MDTRRCAITNQNKIKYIQKQNLIILLHECVHSNVCIYVLVSYDSQNFKRRERKNLDATFRRVYETQLSLSFFEAVAGQRIQN